MITAEITFFAPRSLDEAVRLLAEHGDEAKLMGGGMSLMPTMNLGLARPSVVISLNHVQGLDAVTLADGQLRIGGLVRHARVASDALIARHVPLLAEAAQLIGDTQVRNRGTLGGSIAHADPAADYLPVMVVTGATIVVSSVRGARELAAEAFFVDILTSAVEPDEVVTEVRIPVLGERDGSAYRRLARLEGSFPIVNAAAIVRSDRSARVAIGGVAGRPVLVDVSASIDAAGAVALEAVAEAASAACVDAFADLSGDSEYRQAMAGVYARRAVEAAAAAAG
jgi:CO/xanthine dehydrogenase FAD-binding subunit